jgi:hypothetical protein
MLPGVVAVWDLRLGATPKKQGVREGAKLKFMLFPEVILLFVRSVLLYLCGFDLLVLVCVFACLSGVV